MNESQIRFLLLELKDPGSQVGHGVSNNAGSKQYGEDTYYANAIYNQGLTIL